LRDGAWKLIEHYEDGRVELYNLDDDPGETKDLAAKEMERATKMKERLAGWRKRVGAQENTPNPDFDATLHRKLYVDVDVSSLTARATAAEMRPGLEAWRKLMNEVLRAKKP
jgi:hypothetical protein